MCQRAQQRFEWIVVLQAAEHGSKNQHHSKRRAVLSEVEALKSYLADPINAKPGEHMHDVVGFLEPVNHELVCVGYWRGIDQGVGSDSKAYQLICIATSEAPVRQGFQLL